MIVSMCGECFRGTETVKQQQHFSYKVTHFVTLVNYMAAHGRDGLNVCVPSTVSLRQSLQFSSMQGMLEEDIFTTVAMQRQRASRWLS